MAVSAQHTLEVSRAGRQAVQGAIESMGRIKDQVSGIAEAVSPYVLE